MLAHCDGCQRTFPATIFISPDSDGQYASPSYYLPYSWCVDGTRTYCSSDCAAVARGRVH